MTDCKFERNYGTNTAFGSAVSIDGMHDEFRGSTPDGAGAPDTTGTSSTLESKSQTIQIAYGKDKASELTTRSRLISIKNSIFEENSSG